ncbi:MAG: hypothetical protein E3J72_01875 [Planctomycetota bacterium]|nr:MAG: hypothetical protein E3J72_01875 [Planctomycetota bacterium]
MNLAIPRIDSYEFGRITIDRKTYTSDVIITPEGVAANWWRKEGHSLHPEDLNAVTAVKPEVLIVGCGASGILKVPDKTRQWISEKGIELIDLPTREACDRYNELSESKNVAAGLHLTC